MVGISRNMPSPTTFREQLDAHQGHKQRWVVTTVHVFQALAGWVNDGHKKGDVFLSLGDFHDPLIQGNQGLLKRPGQRQTRRALALEVAHHQCGADALPTDVRHANDRLLKEW